MTCLDVARLVELDDALLAVDGEERAGLLAVLADDDLDPVAPLGLLWVDERVSQIMSFWSSATELKRDP